jgi:hypothetical protein
MKFTMKTIFGILLISGTSAPAFAMRFPKMGINAYRCNLEYVGPNSFSAHTRIEGVFMARDNEEATVLAANAVTSKISLRDAKDQRAKAIVESLQKIIKNADSDNEFVLTCNLRNSTDNLPVGSFELW